MPAALAATRMELRKLLMPKQRRLHFSTESDRRRHIILSVLLSLDARAVVYTCGGLEERARAACLSSLVRDALDRGTQRIVLESREIRDHHDRRVIRDLTADRAHSPLTYEHMKAYEEPLLWVPDAVGWCFGAGGSWRKRVSPLIDKATELEATSG
jgi:hypothetical protein